MDMNKWSITEMYMNVRMQRKENCNFSYFFVFNFNNMNKAILNML